MGERKEGRTGSEDELWGAVYTRLVPWTVRRHRVNPADAEEMVQDAVRLFVESGGTADPRDVRGLLAALGSRINGIAVDRRRKKANRAVSMTKDGDPAEPPTPENPADRMVRADEARKAIEALLERVRGDALVTSIVLQMSDGVVEPAAQAKVLGCDVTDVYNARRRLKVHVEAIQKMMGSWG
jgi:DNA-directed RNA polymerase specialized sigma24 family protein